MKIVLLGCTHHSFGSYLKSLAVLRLVTQADGDAAARWMGPVLEIDSKFDREGLLRFFLEEYRPTSILAPWNKASGFHPKEGKDGVGAVHAILGTTGARFAQYRADIAGAKAIVAEIGSVDRKAKREIVLRCRNRLSDSCVQWLDAVIAISSDESSAFAPVLGTGGNDGHLDFTNNFMERLANLLIAPKKRTSVRELLESALFGTSARGLQSIKAGQFDPGRAGGFNQGEKIKAAPVANPWDAVLTLEGAAAWAGGVYRKQGVSYESMLCSPFTVRVSAAGYASATMRDTSAAARAEIWTPIWREPSRFAEVEALLREGRASVDGKAARTGLDFAQAAASLGVDRGIAAFVRFSILQRRGDSYIALRSGEFEVKHRSGADLLRELTPFAEAATRAAKGPDGQIPNSWPTLQRALDEAMFSALLHDRKDLLVEVASAFGAMCKWLTERKRTVYWPSRRLGENWIAHLWGSVPEVRIAAALASMRTKDKPAGQDNLRFQKNVDPTEPEYSWLGRDLPARMLATLRRRTLDGAQSEASPFFGVISAYPSDAIAFLEGRVNDETIENLTFAFLRAKFPKGSALRREDRHSGSEDVLGRWPAYCVLKQFFSVETHAPVDAPRFRPDASIVALLQGGQLARAMQTALRRLRISGVEVVVSRGWDSEDAVRLGAALLIPVWSVPALRKTIVRTQEELRTKG